MSVVKNPYNDLLFDVEFLNQGEASTKIWFSFYFGHLAETITFLNMIVKAVNNIKDNDSLILDPDHYLLGSSHEGEKRLGIVLNKSLCTFSRDELVTVRDSFLKLLKDI